MGVLSVLYHACVCTLRDQKKALDMGLELQTAVSCQLAAEN